jgi:spoIIIJ-associated protein
MIKKEHKSSANLSKKDGSKYIEVEGKTSQEAIQKALLQLNTTRDKVIVKILCEGEKGLYGMSGGKLTKVRVTLKDGP